jgi:hypothetical protein
VAPPQDFKAPASGELSRKPFYPAAPCNGACPDIANG